MPSHNAYAQYKRDTNHLLYWIINTFNAALDRSGSTPPHGEPSSVSHVQTKQNTTGQTTVAGLVEMSRHIAVHCKNKIPSTIFRLFQSVIQARGRASATFQQLAENSDDLELKTSNEKHQHFIDALTEAFEVLGGEYWTEEVERENPKEEEEEDFAKVIFANKFASLNLGTTAASESSDDEAAPGPVYGSDSKRSRQARKNTKSKKKAKAKPNRPEIKAQPLDDVPLESYRIIEEHDAGNGGTMTEYLFAVTDLFGQMAKHRGHMQLIWHEVAFNGLNSAVAAGVANCAASMVQDTVSEIFIDFPGHESYETCMKTITRGDPSHVDGLCQLSLLKHDGDPRQAKHFKTTVVDVWEHLEVHTFYALRDFLIDFQKNHTGRPTKRMAAEIAHWNPHLDLEQVTKEQRVQWRRSFTINWLYDLINQFSFAGWYANNKTGNKHDFAKVDWTSSGPWHFESHRRLFGHKMISFAEHITSLAWQPASVNNVPKILPQHVFQLTCIVDSMTVARGWLNHPLQGHMLRAPTEISPKRDIDIFLDREDKRFEHGWISAVDNVKRGLQNSEMIDARIGVFQPLATMLDMVTVQFREFLGEAKNIHGISPLPPSRFASTAPGGNGLSEYCAYFCGDGLLEALDIAFHCGMRLWDDTPEPFMAVHLHNMLAEQGVPRYIEKVGGMWGLCEGIFTEEVFGSLDIPQDKHEMTFSRRIKEITQWSSKSTRKIKAFKTDWKNAKTVSERCDGNFLRVFRTRSFASALVKADFNIDRVSDQDIRYENMMGLFRLDEVKVANNPETGQPKLEDTELVLRSRKRGMKDSEFLRNKFQNGPVMGLDDPVKGVQNLPERFKGDSNFSQLDFPQLAKRSQFDEPAILDAIKSDLHTEICCWRRPYLGMNYLWGCAWAMTTFQKIEKELSERGHPTYHAFYGMKNDRFMVNKRIALTAHALRGVDEELCRVVGDVFDRQHGNVESVTYWDLERRSDMDKQGKYQPEHQCCIL